MIRRGWWAGAVLLLAAALVAGALPARGQGDGGMIDDFEQARDWWCFENGGTITATREPADGRDSSAGRLDFAAGAGQWPGCGLTVQPSEAWTAAGGLGFAWRGDPPGLLVTVTVNMADPTHPNGLTPFEATQRVPGDWTPAFLPWNAFAKPDWAGPDGAATLDPARIAEIIFVSGQEQRGALWLDDLGLGAPPVTAPVAPPEAAPLPDGGAYDKFALWTGGPHLRGANIWQRVVVPEVDGPDFLGAGHIGPPYIQADFDRLAALGANYVNISGPGLFTETPPYILDEAVQANLDALLDMIAAADMFAVISARTGPGRSDFTFYDDGIEDWGDPALVVETVWTDATAQDAWGEMWRYTAQRYRDHPVVVGYDLMVEPNAAGRLLGIYEPGDFYPAYAGTRYDWNQFYPRLVAAIRTVDTATPVLVGAMGWSAVRWLPALEPVDDPRIVYMAHQYWPQTQYTHQHPLENRPYPGQYDIDWDGEPDDFDRDRLAAYLAPVEAFQAAHGVPVGINEFGVVRWAPDAAAFMRDELALFEALGVNHALWVFNPAWLPHQRNDSMDFLHGPDPADHAADDDNALLAAIRANWSLNTVRPSTVAAR